MMAARLRGTEKTAFFTKTYVVICQGTNMHVRRMLMRKFQLLLLAIARGVWNASSGEHVLSALTVWLCHSPLQGWHIQGDLAMWDTRLDRSKG